MPAFPWLLSDNLDFAAIEPAMRAHVAVGVPYGDAEVAGAAESAMEQARTIAAEIVDQGGEAGLEGKKITALIAYLQRLGTDISRPEAVELLPADLPFVLTHP